MSFEEYLRGFSDDVTFEIDSNNTYYLRYRKERVKNHNLYVYKLEDEKNAEILITNFDFPESVVSLLNSSLSKSNKIPKFIKEDFHKHFHAKFAKVKIEK
ncbi:MAG: hypothetical protein J6B75_09610 [Ruminococcus sp.]|nr:hypothetical protein [Ruminococcus sp.]